MVVKLPSSQLMAASWALVEMSEAPSAFHATLPELLDSRYCLVSVGAEIENRMRARHRGGGERKIMKKRMGVIKTNRISEKEKIE